MLVLCGPPGVGKTTVGRLCAQLLGWPFVDTDQALQNRLGLSVPDFLQTRGETALRQQEHLFVQQLDDTPRVLAVGGGLIGPDPTRRLLKERGFLCGLNASLHCLLARLAQSNTVRPLLLPRPQTALATLLEERENAYRDVHVRLAVDDLSPEQAAQAVVALWRAVRGGNGLVPAVTGLASSVQYLPDWPTPQQLPTSCLLIYDQRLENLPGAAAAKAWISAFPFRYGVVAGEPLKDLSAFSEHVNHIQQLLQKAPSDRLPVVALGGGTVGDFAGFFASVWKRGVPLVQLPSTWLAALDSAHGGKNALNANRAKNQLGTFAAARQVLISKPLLELQPPERAQEAMGELVKMAILDGGPWVQELLLAQTPGAELLWRLLPQAVAAKYRIVQQDPWEKLGIRHLLNLGHTVGHIFETACGPIPQAPADPTGPLQLGLPHGLAVAQGLRFALHFSTQKGLLPAAKRDWLLGLLQHRLGLPDLQPFLTHIPRDLFVSLLSQDKKRSGEKTVRFVFVCDVGQPVVKDVTLEELTTEACRQGVLL